MNIIRVPIYYSVAQIFTMSEVFFYEGSSNVATLQWSVGLHRLISIRRVAGGAVRGASQRHYAAIARGRQCPVCLLRRRCL